MSRFAERTRVLGAVAPASVMNWLKPTAAAGVIKSIQQGTIVLSGVASNTATITSVSTANAYVAWIGAACNTNPFTDREAVSVALTNATTVTASRQSTTDDVTVGYVVVECMPGVLKSVQECSIALTAGNVTGTATITSVNTAKSIIVLRGFKFSGATNDWRSAFQTVLVTNATTITGTRVVSANTSTVYATVVEFV